MKLTRTQIQSLPFITLFALFTACFIAYPLHIDDYWMMEAFNNGYGPDGDVLEGMKTFFEKRYFKDTPRISNFIVLPFLYLPPWISGVVSAAALAATYVLMCSLAGIKRTDFGGNTVLAFLLTFCFPWSDQPLFTRDYAANYLWELPLMLWLIKRYLGTKPLNCCLAFFSGLILGMWHERFAVPLAGAAVGLLAFKKVRLRGDRIWLIVGLLTGILWIFTAPGTWSRVDNQIQLIFRFSVLAHLMWFGPGFFLFLIFCIIGRHKESAKRRAAAPLSCFVCIFCTLSVGVLITADKTRACIPGLVLGFVGMIYMLGALKPRWIYTPGCRGRVLWWTLLAVSVAHMTTALYGIIEIRNEDRAIRNVWERHTLRPIVIFAEITDDFNRPWYMVRKNFFEHHSNGWQWKKYSACHRLPLHEVIPYELKNFDLSMGEPIKGNAGAVFYKGRIVLLYAGDYKRLSVYYGNESMRNTRAVFPGRGGRKLIYVSPYYRVWERIVAPDSVVIMR